MKRENILKIIGYAFVLLFVYTAMSKLFAYSTYLNDLRRSPELGAFAIPISIIIPPAELLSAVLLLIPRWRLLGYWIATILMLAFTLYVAYVLVFATDLPCTCGGIIRELSWPQHLVFNISFTILAFIGLRLSLIANSEDRNTNSRTAITL